MLRSRLVINGARKLCSRRLSIRDASLLVRLSTARLTRSEKVESSNVSELAEYVNSILARDSDKLFIHRVYL